VIKTSAFAEPDAEQFAFDFQLPITKLPNYQFCISLGRCLLRFQSRHNHRPNQKAVLLDSL
jgi:hypothetical protein